MMQASDGDNDGGPSDENDSFERKPLLHLPQHATAFDGDNNGANGGASLRSRRRHVGLQPSMEGMEAFENDSKFSYPSLPAGGESVSSFNGNGRPGGAMGNKIKSISRIGRSASIDERSEKSAYEDDPNCKEEYYFDDSNDYSWDCTFGTQEGDGIWLVTPKQDPPGIVMSIIVWILIIYSGITITLLADSSKLSHTLAYLYNTICALALASHVKTMLSDPGAIPSCAVPIDSASKRHETHLMCRACKSYKPPNSHHCRMCNRCVSRMDHHCPWMNNCIGASNLKSFILFLCYTWVGCAFALIIFGLNYFLCQDESCEFPGVLVQLVRVMTVICTGSILFVSSMLANVTFGFITGTGTIDRLKRRIAKTEQDADDPPLDFEDIFGVGSKLTWFLPIDPIFPDHDKVLGFSMPQRLLREGNENTSVC